MQRSARPGRRSQLWPRSFASRCGDARPVCPRCVGGGITVVASAVLALIGFSAPAGAPAERMARTFYVGEGDEARGDRGAVRRGVPDDEGCRSPRCSAPTSPRCLCTGLRSRMRCRRWPGHAAHGQALGRRVDVSSRTRRRADAERIHRSPPAEPAVRRGFLDLQRRQHFLLGAARPGVRRSPSTWRRARPRPAYRASSRTSSK